MTFNLQNKKVTIIGAARSGIAVANAVVHLGGIAKISEYKLRDAVAKELSALTRVEQVIFEFGGHTKGFIEDSDYIVLSPGVRQDIVPVLWAKAAGIEVLGEIEFAYRLCPCSIIAVTGSNGKTTTVTLITEILRKAGKKPVLCGNIGSPFSAHILNLTAEHIVVLEISSFQLESTTTFKPYVALWLNFAPNHLDRHNNLQEYFDAKSQIFANQDKNDFALLNAQQSEFQTLAKKLKSKVIFFFPEGGEHPNSLAALAVARICGIPDTVSSEVFANFKGVEHRQEFVRTFDSVDYINDSKSTTPEAGQCAMIYFRKPLVMICGGSDKHLDFSHLKKLVGQKVKHMIVLGQTKEILQNIFKDVVPVSVCASLEEAIIYARSKAKSGDIVLLSPMCASFDMFKDYEHRGRCFKEIVNNLM